MTIDYSKLIFIVLVIFLGVLFLGGLKESLRFIKSQWKEFTKFDLEL